MVIRFRAGQQVVVKRHGKWCWVTVVSTDGFDVWVVSDKKALRRYDFTKVHQAIPKRTPLAISEPSDEELLSWATAGGW